jgi:hypothetical protein
MEFGKRYVGNFTHIIRHPLNPPPHSALPAGGQCIIASSSVIAFSAASLYPYAQSQKRKSGTTVKWFVLLVTKVKLWLMQKAAVRISASSRVFFLHRNST